MAGIKVSELDKAETLNETDILYIIRNSVEGGMESKQASLGDLLSMLGSVSSKGLERIQLGNKTQQEFNELFNGQLVAEKPDRPTCTMMMVLESLENGAQGSMGSITVFPVSEGKYVLGSGPNALGDGNLGIALLYLPNDLADGVSMLCWFSPSVAGGGSGGGSGKDGTSITLKGSVSDFSALPPAGSNQIGDCWFVESTLYNWNGVDWENLGDFRGPQGLEGPMGPMLEFAGVFNTVEELPIDVNVNTMATVGTFFYFFNGGEWISLGNFAGPKGDPGQASFAIKSGNFSSNYPDTLTVANPHGFLGTKEYWKTTINLDKATYNQYPVCNVLLQELPCDANGVPVPYDLHYYFNSSGANKPPNIVLMLILHEPATQLLSNSTAQYGPLGLVNNIQYEPHYSVSYWY